MHYVVRVFVPRAPMPIERLGLSFKAICLGASLGNLQAQSKTTRGVTAALRNTLNAIDGGMAEKDVDGIIADWLDDPDFIPTPPLAPGDKVRIVLQSPAGTTETTVNVAGPLNDAFLKGASE